MLDIIKTYRQIQAEGHTGEDKKKLEIKLMSSCLDFFLENCRNFIQSNEDTIFLNEELIAVLNMCDKHIELSKMYVRKLKKMSCEIENINEAAEALFERIEIDYKIKLKAMRRKKT